MPRPIHTDQEYPLSKREDMFSAFVQRRCTNRPPVGWRDASQDESFDASDRTSTQRGSVAALAESRKSLVEAVTVPYQCHFLKMQLHVIRHPESLG